MATGIIACETREASDSDVDVNPGMSWPTPLREPPTMFRFRDPNHHHHHHRLVKFVREDAIFGQSHQDKAERKRPKNLRYPLRLVFGQKFFPRPGCGMIDEELQVHTSEGGGMVFSSIGFAYRVLDAVFQENCICASSNLCEPARHVALINRFSGDVRTVIRAKFVDCVNVARTKAD